MTTMTTMTDNRRAHLLETLTEIDTAAKNAFSDCAMPMATTAALLQCVSSVRRVLNPELPRSERYRYSLDARSCFAMAPKKLDKTHPTLLPSLYEAMWCAEKDFAASLDA